MRNRKIFFFTSQPKHMVWVLKRTVSMRRFFWAPKTYAKIMGTKIFTILRWNFFIYLNLWLWFYHIILLKRVSLFTRDDDDFYHIWVLLFLTLSILMYYSFSRWFGQYRIVLLYCKGLKGKISMKWWISVPGDIFYLTVQTQIAIFHLDLHCLSKYLLTGI